MTPTPIDRATLSALRLAYSLAHAVAVYSWMAQAFLRAALRHSAIEGVEQEARWMPWGES